MRLLSMQGFPLSVETIRPWHASFIYCTHWEMALVARDLHLVILDNVLLDKCLSRLIDLTMLYGFGVEVGLGYKAGIAWNIHCRLCCSNVKFIYIAG